jgi:glycosyltransferase involved in cell wall biosynthesis
MLVIEPCLRPNSPSMKSFVLALPRLAEHFDIDLWTIDADESERYKVVRLPRFLAMRFIGAYLFSFAAWLRWLVVYGLSRKKKPDLICTQAWLYPFADVCLVNFSAWDWDKRQRGIGFHSLRDRVEWLLNLSYKQYGTACLSLWPARLYLPVSEAVAQDLRAVNPRANMQLLPNSYDAARFNPQVRERYRVTKRRELGCADGDCVFLFASLGHYRRKGFDLAAEAIKQLHQRQPHVQLLVVGGQSHTLQRLQQSLDLTHPGWHSWLQFAGMTTRMEEYYAAADGLLFPSHSEAFSLVEIEAAACQLPLFLTPHHGSEMLLQDGLNGRRLEFDAENIAAVLEEFATGRWSPVPVTSANALDLDQYAERLISSLRPLLNE